MRKLSGTGYYIHRGNWIEPFGGGWMWMEQTLMGHERDPIYKALVDAKNAIDKSTDGTHKVEPRIIGYARYEIGNGWVVE